MTTKKRTITLKTQVMDVIDEKARDENRNFSNMVETMLINYLRQHDNYAI